jgi:hypothetical protein
MNWQKSPPAPSFSWLERLRARLRPSHRKAQTPPPAQPHDWQDHGNEWPDPEPLQINEPLNHLNHRFRSATYFPQNDSFLVTLLDGRAYQLFGASLSADPTFDQQSIITGVRLDPEENDHFTIQFASGATLEVSWERVLDKCVQNVPEDGGSLTPIPPSPSLYEAQHVRWLERQIETLQAALLDRVRFPLSAEPHVHMSMAPVVCPHCYHTVSVAPAGTDTKDNGAAAKAGTQVPMPEKPMPAKTQPASRRPKDEVLEELESRVNALRKDGEKRAETKTGAEEPTLKEAIKEAGEQVRDGNDDEFAQAMRSLAAAGTKVGLRKAKDKLLTSAAPALRRGFLSLVREMLEGDDKPKTARNKD